MTPSDLENPAAPRGPLVRVRMDVAYDGREFHGFSESPGVPTVASVLREALEKLWGHSVEMVCAGRTDAGVHARGQVVSFDMVASVMPPGKLVRRVSKLTGPRIVVTDCRAVVPEFDARRWAVRRHYRYTISNRIVPDPLREGFCWHVHNPLDLNAMRLAADPLIGAHDFSSFCRRPKLKPGEEPITMVRRMQEICVHQIDDEIIEIHLSANAFCYQMVRSIVGVIVCVGYGKLKAGDVKAILEAKDRNLVPRVAPPEGLVLWQVDYGDGPKEGP
ncbi:MAG: tRNA pseudouridine(38-40) synthase TruA [Acidimicrobiales bacterium]